MASSIQHTEILEVQKSFGTVKQHQVKPLKFIVEQMDLSPSKTLAQQSFEKSSYEYAKTLNEMPGKHLELKHQNSSTSSKSNDRTDQQQRFKIQCISTSLSGSKSTNNNFLLSPGALHRTQSTLSMSLLKYKHKQSLSNGPCEKIKEVDETKEWTQNSNGGASAKETIQQLHCLRNMLTKKQKNRAPPSYKNRCQNCHILNMTMFKKASPKKQLLLKNQQNFEKLIDEQVFSDDEGENDEIDNKISCSANSSFLRIQEPMGASTTISRQNSKKQQNTLVCPNCQTTSFTSSNKTAKDVLRQQLNMVTATASTNTDNSTDNLKRLPSKRGLQEFLEFPKRSKITIEESYEEVSDVERQLSEPGSTKIIQTEINGQQITSVVENKSSKPNLENGSPDLSIKNKCNHSISTLQLQNELLTASTTSNETLGPENPEPKTCLKTNLIEDSPGK